MLTSLPHLFEKENVPTKKKQLFEMELLQISGEARDREEPESQSQILAPFEAMPRLASRVLSGEGD